MKEDGMDRKVWFLECRRWVRNGSFGGVLAQLCGRRTEY